MYLLGQAIAFLSGTHTKCRTENWDSHEGAWFPENCKPKIGVGGGENSEPLNLSLGWPSVCGAKVIVFQEESDGFPKVLVAGKIRIR